MIKSSFQIELSSLLEVILCFYFSAGQTESNYPVLCCNPAAILLVSEQESPSWGQSRARPGLGPPLSSLRHSHASCWCLHLHTGVYICISREAGLEMFTLRVQMHLHSTKGYLSGFLGCLVSILLLKTLPWDGLSLQGIHIISARGCWLHLLVLFPGLAALLPAHGGL